MTIPHKRRWFRFSLRTMFVVVTIFGVWLGWNLKIVRERKAVLTSLKQHNGDEPIVYRVWELGKNLEQVDNLTLDLRDYAPVQVSLVRRLMGDETCALLWMPRFIDPSLIERAEYCFPEAELCIYDLESHPEYGSTSLEIVAFRDSLYTRHAERKLNKGDIFKTGLIEK